MVLLSGPSVGNSLGVRAAAALESAASPAAVSDVLTRIIAALRTPGTPASESLKAAAPRVSDLMTYEREGYAVFLFVRWTGVSCAVTVRAVPEGYGIPFVH